MSDTYRHKAKGKFTRVQNDYKSDLLDETTRHRLIEEIQLEAGYANEHVASVKAFGKAKPGALKSEVVRLNREDRHHTKRQLKDVNAIFQLPKAFAKQPAKDRVPKWSPLV